VNKLSHCWLSSDAPTSTIDIIGITSSDILEEDEMGFQMMIQLIHQIFIFMTRSTLCNY